MTASATSPEDGDLDFFLGVWKKERHRDIPRGRHTLSLLPKTNGGSHVQLQHGSEVQMADHSSTAGPHSCMGVMRHLCIRCSWKRRHADARHQDTPPSATALLRGYQRQCASRCNRQTQIGFALRTRLKLEGTTLWIATKLVSAATHQVVLAGGWRVGPGLDLPIL